MNSQVPGRAYRTLDGLRGVAALIVATRHSSGVIAYGAYPESFLAVDLFFLLSGFVIADAYAARLRDGGWLKGFVLVRLRRLYPLYVLGLCLGIAGVAAAAALHGGAPDSGFLLKALVAGLLMAPAVPPLLIGGSTLDGPTWTLLPELVANLVYAVAVRRLTKVVLCVVVAAGAAAVVACEYRYGTLDGGWSAATFPVIGARLAFSFFLGVLLHRLKPERRIGAMTAWACLTGLGLLLVARPPVGWRHGFELAAVLLAFPLLVVVAVRREPGRLSGALFSFLGAISYAVYVLHQPMGVLAALALAHGVGLRLPHHVVAGGFLLCVAAVAALADKVYDQPVRRWLATLRAPSGEPSQTRLSAGEA